MKELAKVSLHVCLLLILLSDVFHEAQCLRQTKRHDAEKDEQSDDTNSKSLDLSKLLSTGKPLSIKSKETSTLDEKGNTAKKIKEIEIGTPGSEERGLSSSNKEEGNQIDSLVSALKTGSTNASLTNVNSPLSAANGPLSKYPSVNELSKEPFGNQSVSSEAPINQTSESALSEESHNLTNASHSDTSDSALSEASHNHGNESHSELEETGSDAAHLSTNQSSSVSSDSLPAASSAGAQPSSSNNQSSVEVTGDSAKTSTGSQIALVPVSLPSSLISQLTGALGNNASATVNSDNTTSANTISSLTSQNNTQSADNANDTMGLKSDNSALGNSDASNLLSNNKGNGAGVIFLTKIMSNGENAPVKEKSDTGDGYKRFDIDLTYEEAPDDDDNDED